MTRSATSPSAEAYEKLGAFYLGRSFDPSTGETAAEPLLYDAKDLTTHAVMIGMTGSGKTGLAISLLEEAAIDGVPALVVDPKGDLGNLLLNFPDLEPENFRPWVQADEAARKGLSVDELAAREAKKWREGLAGWGQDGERLRRLRDAAEVRIYTPGSDAGEPISILSSFNAPGADVLADGDLFQERIGTAVASLLGLLGIDADPVKSREAILLANVLQDAWKKGENLDLATLIQRVQSPPFERVGVFPLETFFPSGDRFELAMALNNLLASPGFASWLQGTPLDVGELLYTADGKPRLAILSIAHLDDAERMFFVSLLLNETLSWMRGRPGTTSLRSLLYMDEVFGYLPPIGNPPSKKPMLTLLKQARAFGLGVVLATQNPVDLDYKALSNIGTWFLGRLQTERDQARVMDGLEGGGGLDRKEIERLLAGMAKRTFLLHNVHEKAPEMFQVRWAMSYLCGPLTRDQIKKLAADAPPSEPAAGTGKAVDTGAPAAPRLVSAVPITVDAAPPVLPPEIDQRFHPSGGGEETWAPALGLYADVRFVDSRKKLEAEESVAWVVPIPEDGDRVDWDAAQPLGAEFDDLADTAPSGVTYAPLPQEAGDVKSYKSWKKEADDHLYRERRFEIWHCADYKLYGEPEESEREVRIRARELAHEERDLEIEKLRKRYAKKFATLDDRLRRARFKVEEEREEAKSAKMQGVLEAGASLVGALLSRRRKTSTAIRRAASGWRRGRNEAMDVEKAQSDLIALQGQLADLDRELESEIAALRERFEAVEVTPFELKPRRSDVDVRWLGIVWLPG